MTGLAGLLLTSATGASAQCLPRARPSRAVTSPVKRAASSERLAPTAMAQGRGTVPRRTLKARPRSTEKCHAVPLALFQKSVGRVLS